MARNSTARHSRNWLVHCTHGKTAQKDGNKGARLNLDSCSVTFPTPMKFVSLDYIYAI